MVLAPLEEGLGGPGVGKLAMELLLKLGEEAIATAKRRSRK